MTTFKAKCGKCRINYAIVTQRVRFPICDGCKAKELEGEIKDPEMKKLFDIPYEFYMKNSFLTDIKIKYLKFGSLSEKQIEAFKKIVSEMKTSK